MSYAPRKSFFIFFEKCEKIIFILFRSIYLQKKIVFLEKNVKNKKNLIFFEKKSEKKRKKEKNAIFLQKNVFLRYTLV